MDAAATDPASGPVSDGIQSVLAVVAEKIRVIRQQLCDVYRLVGETEQKSGCVLVAAHGVDSSLAVVTIPDERT